MNKLSNESLEQLAEINAAIALVSCLFLLTLLIGWYSGLLWIPIPLAVGMFAISLYHAFQYRHTLRRRKRHEQAVNRMKGEQ